uniref:Microtubule-associated protein n=1 Tax=Eptatretus burgeri TaxID=7764 RepID=A0A8C4NL35_EPTBU
MAMDFSEATLQEISLQIVEKAKAAAIAIISQERGSKTADGGGASVGVGNGSMKTLCNQLNLPPSSDSKRSTTAQKDHIEKKHSSPTKIPRSTRNPQESGGERSNRRRVPPPIRIVESSLERSATETGACSSTCRKIKPTKAKIFSKKMDFSHVQSKCGSLDNIKHVPGSGRHVQVTQQKFDYRHVRSRCGTWANREKKAPSKVSIVQAQSTINEKTTNA